MDLLHNLSSSQIKAFIDGQTKHIPYCPIKKSIPYRFILNFTVEDKPRVWLTCLCGWRISLYNEDDG